MNLGGFKIDIRVEDVLQMKKKHPCGDNKMFKVLRSGMDFRLSCIACGRVFMVPRVKAEKSIVRVFRNKIDVTEISKNKKKSSEP